MGRVLPTKSIDEAIRDLSEGLGLATWLHSIRREEERIVLVARSRAALAGKLERQGWRGWPVAVEIIEVDAGRAGRADVMFGSARVSVDMKPPAR